MPYVVWNRVADDLKKLDSYLHYISQLMYYGVCDVTLFRAASETTGGGMPSLTSVVNFNHFLASANLYTNSIFRKFNNAFIEQTFGFLEF